MLVTHVIRVLVSVLKIEISIKNCAFHFSELKIVVYKTCYLCFVKK